MQKAALYIRVSTDDQLEYSPDAQKRLLLDYARKNDIVVDEDYIFLDDGYSGRKAEKRPAFMRMIGMAKLKPPPFDIILVHKFDRFARSREDSVVYKSLLRKDGIKVISATEHLEDDKFSIILESMLEAMAEYYSINLSEEVKKGMTEKALRGEVQTAPPHGYEVKDNVYVINPDLVQDVWYIRDRILSGETSFYRIAKELNAMGRRTRFGKLFETRTVEYIARNIVYTGMIVWCPDGKKGRDFNKDSLIIVPGKHEAAISPDDFKKMQEILDSQPKRIKNAQPNNTYRHWLSGLLRCDTCGASLAFSGSRCPGYQCRGYSNGKCTVSHRISLAKLEPAVFASLEEIINGCTGNYTTVKRNVDQEQIEKRNLEKALEKTEIKLQRAKQAYLDGIDTADEYKENKASIQAEKEKILHDLDAYKVVQIDNKRFKNQIKNLYDLLKSDASLMEKSEAAHQLIEKIVYVKSEERLEFSYYI